MRKESLIIIFAIAISAGCIPPVAVKYVTLPAHSEKIQEAINGTAEKLAKSPLIMKGKIYELVNIEASETAQDDKLNAMLRDTFTYYILKKEAVIAERDDDIITHILFESGSPFLRGLITEKYTLEDIFDRASILTKDKGEINISVGQPQIPDYDKYSKFLFLKGKEKLTGEDKLLRYLDVPYIERFTESTILNPDYIIAYRIYECGVTFYDEGDYNEVTREARALIYVELVDAKKGTVVWSDYLNSAVKDKIPRNYIDELEEGKYSFYGFTHPALQQVKGVKFAPVVAEVRREKMDVSLKKEKYSTLDVTGYLIIDNLQRFKQPPAPGLEETNYGGGAGVVYNPSTFVKLGIYFDGSKGDLTVIRTSGGIDFKLPVAEFVSPVFGLKLGWSGITLKDDGWDYLHIVPRFGLDIGKKYGGYVFVEYNKLNEIRGTTGDYAFESTLSFIIGARIGLF